MDVLLLLAATLRISVPYALAAAGASFSERGGVVNIALEGIMLNSALAYVLGVWWSGQPIVGLGAALLAGLLTAALHAWITVGLRAEQITSGIGINLLSAGLTRYVLVTVFGSSSNSPRVPGFEPMMNLDALPGLGPVLSSPLVLAGIAFVPAAHWLMFNSVFGLRLRSVGERPESVAALGLPVTAYRAAGVLISGLFAGLAGAWLASEQHSFTDGMTNGRGYVAIAAMIVGRWSPLGAAVACIVFGAAEALQITLQGSGFPSELIQMLPYGVTMLVVSGFLGRSIPPRALGTPFVPERSR